MVYYKCVYIWNNYFELIRLLRYDYLVLSIMCLLFIYEFMEDLFCVVNKIVVVFVVKVFFCYC